MTQPDCRDHDLGLLHLRVARTSGFLLCLQADGTRAPGLHVDAEAPELAVRREERLEVLHDLLQRVGQLVERKAIAGLKKQPPGIVVAEFFYGYGNNYAGVNVSNLDVFLHSLRKYAPRAQVIVMVHETELAHVDKLRALFDIHAVLTQPVSERQMAESLARRFQDR